MTDQHHVDARPETIGTGTPASRQVTWFDVYGFVVPLLTSAGGRPTAGTPAWNALDDDDPAKLDAVLILGVHMALRLDTEQEQRAEASRAIAAMPDWRPLARGAAYIERKAAS